MYDVSPGRGTGGLPATYGGISATLGRGCGAVEPATVSAVLSALVGRAEVTMPIPSETGVWLATDPY